MLAWPSNSTSAATRPIASPTSSPTRLGDPVVDVVVEALRDYGSKLPPVDDMTPTQRAGYEALRKLAEEGGQAQDARVRPRTILTCMMNTGCPI